MPLQMSRRERAVNGLSWGLRVGRLCPTRLELRTLRRRRLSFMLERIVPAVCGWFPLSREFAADRQHVRPVRCVVLAFLIAAVVDDAETNGACKRARQCKGSIARSTYPGLVSNVRRRLRQRCCPCRRPDPWPSSGIERHDSCDEFTIFIGAITLGTAARKQLASDLPPSAHPIPDTVPDQSGPAAPVPPRSPSLWTLRP